MSIQLIRATAKHFDKVFTLAQQFHKTENIFLSDADPTQTLKKLITDDSLGQVWLIRLNDETIGYIALCFGYSIERGGRDAFIDEFYLIEPERNQGYGKTVLLKIQAETKSMGIKALHLEVDSTNNAGLALYKATAFKLRNKYKLMTYKIT